MSDDQEQEDSGVRRIGRKDRKKRLDPRKPLFPEEDAGEDDPHKPFKRPLEDTDAEAETPTLTPEPAAAPARPVPPDDDERFPPLNPKATPPPPVEPPRQPRYLLQNFLALFFLLASIAVGFYYYTIARNPYSALNPFPPFTPVPIFITTTPLPPTIMPIPSPTLTLTFTPLPREVIATMTTFTPAPFPFSLTSNGVVYVPNSNGQNCDWSSIAGSVTGLEGEALDGYRVQVLGDNFNQTVTTGAAITFGPGGYEMPLGSVPIRAEYAVQLLTPEGIPISEVVFIETSDVCNDETQENVAIVSFVQNRGF